MPDVLPDTGRLCRDAAAMGVALTEEQAARVIEFGGLLLRWNRAFNLISRKDQDRLYHRHLLDSLSIAPWLMGNRVMDLGTGAGLPGIPLAIACPDREFTLIDRNERKIRLVGQAVRLLGLRNVEAVCGNVVELARVEDAKRFDVVVTRAVAGAAEAWRLAERSIAPGGRLLVMVHGQRGSGGVGSTPEEAPVGTRIFARESLTIPGLPYPHELLVIERALAARPDSTDRDG